jgi:hypothetical protein
MLNNNVNVAIGMSDGHVIIVGNDSDLPGNMIGSAIKNAVHLPNIGGVWSICGVNNDTQLALGCVSGVHLVNIDAKTLTPTGATYLKDKNIWNVVEYQKN